jgi:hypothetical protein
MTRQRLWLLGCLILTAGLLGCARPPLLVPEVVVKADGPKPEPADQPAPPGPADQGEGFHFPDDQGGKLLQSLLPPTDKQRTVMGSSPQRSFPPLRSLEQPEVPLLPSQVTVVPLPPPKPSPALKPGHTAEETPLTSARSQPSLPQTQSLSPGLLVRTPSVPVERPVSVPVLAVPVPDRASLDDPTRDASLEAALAASPPERPGPAPFLRLRTPDPFENREAVKVRTLPAENAIPLSSTPQLPRP